MKNVINMKTEKSESKGYMSCHICARTAEEKKAKEEWAHYESVKKITLENKQIVPESEFRICGECENALNEHNRVSEIDERGNAIIRKNIFVRAVTPHQKYQSRIILPSSAVKNRKLAVVILIV